MDKNSTSDKLSMTGCRALLKAIDENWGALQEIKNIGQIAKFQSAQNQLFRARDLIADAIKIADDLR